VKVRFVSLGQTPQWKSEPHRKLKVIGSDRAAAASLCSRFRHCNTKFSESLSYAARIRDRLVIVDRNGFLDFEIEAHDLPP
jgi:hypothetical protein